MNAPVLSFQRFSFQVSDFQLLYLLHYRTAIRICRCDGTVTGMKRKCDGDSYKFRPSFRTLATELDAY